MKFKLVADSGTTTPGFDYFGLMLRKGLADTIKNPIDVKGLRFSMPNAGTSGNYAIVKLLEEAGAGVVFRPGQYFFKRPGSVASSPTRTGSVRILTSERVS